MKFRLKELRKNKHLSQVRLAIELCIPQNSISRFESGVRKPDYDTLIQLADYFNVSIDYLVGRSDNPNMI
ncbi:MAG: helix-turn-helix transcriptional regulator [Lachnospiraceae bacterium]|nr:helix-turn-helix transcriptional regulator [Lachnospiraceae bacterium]